VAVYREWLVRFDEAGWRIDIDEFNRRNGKDTAFAIPGPTRRESKNWVIEAIPLVKNSAARKLSVVTA
jgi:predicted pyridoxine 5'-phosphate oxidase superfamily flavin-nucleotide-binding protein